MSKSLNVGVSLTVNPSEDMSVNIAVYAGRGGSMSWRIFLGVS